MCSMSANATDCRRLFVKTQPIQPVLDGRLRRLIANAAATDAERFKHGSIWIIFLDEGRVTAYTTAAMRAEGNNGLIVQLASMFLEESTEDVGRLSAPNGTANKDIVVVGQIFNVALYAGRRFCGISTSFT